MTSFAERKRHEDRIKILNVDKNSFTDAFETSKDHVNKTASTKWKPTEKYMIKHLDPETIENIRKGNFRISQFLYYLANEPSIGLRYVSDHVRRSVPKLVETKKQFKELTSEVDKLNYDLDDSIITIQRLGSIESFKNTVFNLRKSIDTMENMNKRRRFQKPTPLTTPDKLPIPKQFTSPEPTFTPTPEPSSELTSSESVINIGSETPVEEITTIAPTEPIPIGGHQIPQETETTVSSVTTPPKSDLLDSFTPPTAPTVSTSSPYKGTIPFEVKRTKKKKTPKKTTAKLTPKNF